MTCFTRRPESSDSPGPFSQVLMEQCLNYGGARLELRVTAEDAAHPELLAVHVHYSGVRVAVSVIGRESRQTQTCRSANQSAASQTAVPANEEVVGRGEAPVCASPALPVAPAASQTGVPIIQEATAVMASEENLACVPSDHGMDPSTSEAVDPVGQEVETATERHETESSAPGGNGDPVTSHAAASADEEAMSVAGILEQQMSSPTHDVDSATPQVMSVAGISSLEHQMSSPTHDVDSATSQAGVPDEQEVGMTEESPEDQTCSPDEEVRQAPSETGVPVEQDAAPDMEDEGTPKSLPDQNPNEAEIQSTLSLDNVPSEILQNVIYFLPLKQQLSVQRVSRRWRAAVDACLGRRRKLHIGEHDFPKDMDNQTLERLLQKMPALRSLNIDEWGYAPIPLDIDIVSAQCRNLVEVDLTRFCLDAWSLEQLCTSCPGLEVVKLPRMSDDSCVEVLLRRLPGLRSLDLTDTTVKGKCFSLLPASQLERLKLRSFNDFETSCIRQLGRGVQLRDLEILHMNELKSDDLAEGLSGCPLLERLSVDGYGIPQSTWLRQLVHCPQLRELDVSAVLIQENCSANLAEGLSGCPRLERLSVTRCCKLQSTWLRQLVHCPQLRELDVCAMVEAQAADLAEGLAGCPRLERLTVVKLNVPLEQCLPPPPGVLTALRHLDASCSGITDNSLRRLSRLLPGLHTLNIERCEMVTKHGLCYLPRLPELQSLNMAGIEVESDGHDAIFDQLHGSQLRKLRFGNKSCFPGTPEGITRLVVGCPTLKFLQLERLGYRETESMKTGAKSLVHLLVSQLSPDHDVTISVPADILLELPLLPAGPLRLVDSSKVPWEEA